MNILIVEDEPLYSSHLELLVEDLGHLVTGCARSAAAAFRLAEQQTPDLVLMDINIPGDYDGIETAERLQRQYACNIIFITAEEDDRTFQRASRLGPANFLLKPFTDLQVQRAIALSSTRTRSQPVPPDDAGAPGDDENLYVKTGYKLRKVPVVEITSVSADGRYCEIHTLTNRYLIRMTFQELQGRLPANLFLKTHRGHLVNEEFVESVDLRDSEIILRGGRRIPLAKRERESFLRRIEKL